MLRMRCEHLLNVAAGVLMAMTLSAAPPALARERALSISPANASDSGGATCFFRRDWKGGWKATPDARTIYITVSGSVYRLDLASSYRLLRDPWAVLINKNSADTICGPLDLQLTVSNQAGIVQSPVVKRLTRLTPEQVAALPKRLNPR